MIMKSIPIYHRVEGLTQLMSATGALANTKRIPLRCLPELQIKSPESFQNFVDGVLLAL